VSWAVAEASSAACRIFSLSISSDPILAVEMLPSIIGTVSVSLGLGKNSTVLLGKEMQSGRHRGEGVLNKNHRLLRYTEGSFFFNALCGC